MKKFNPKSVVITFLLVFNALNAFSAEFLPLVYLTFENEDTSRFITVNFMSEGKSSSGHAYFDTNSRKRLEDYRYRVKSQTEEVRGIDKTFHHARLKNLTPGQTYYFRVGNEILGFSREYKMRMLPNDGTPIRMIVGGDMGTKPSIVKTSKSALRNEPHVIVIGGDIAYADGKIKNEKRWMKWFKQMEGIMLTPSGYLVPLILAIGNHETSFGRAFFGNRVPFFFKLFPQNGKKAYFKRRLGKYAGLIILDSGHHTTHRKQVKFLESALNSYKDLPHRMAAYHAPLYPNNRNYMDMWAKRGRKYWQPLFDKYRLSVAFEHHDHTLKRTFVIKHDWLSDQGTVYVGDGCWGKGPREFKQKWYLKKSSGDKHVWNVEILENSLNLEASGEKGEVFDKFSIENFLEKTIVRDKEF